MGSGSSKKNVSQAPASGQTSASKAKEKEKVAAKSKPPEPVPKPVAFEVNFEDNNSDSIIRKHPPKHLKRLEFSAEHSTKFTAEMLERKLKLAEENRQRELDKVRRISSASRARRHLRETRDDVEQEFEQTKKSAVKHANNRLREGEEKLRTKASKVEGKAREKLNQMKFDGSDFRAKGEKGKFLGKVDDYDWDNWDEDGEKDTGRQSIKGKSSYLKNENAKQNVSKRGSFLEDDDEFFR